MFAKERVTTAACSTGIEQRVAVLLVYILSFVGGLVFYFIEKDNEFVRFSAMQSLMVGAAWLAVLITLGFFSIIPYLGVLFSLLNYLTSIAYVALCVFLAIEGWKGRKLKVPFVSDLAEQWSRKDSQ